MVQPNPGEIANSGQTAGSVAYYGQSNSDSNKAGIIAEINGERILPIMEIEVTQNSFLTADSFRITMSIPGLARLNPTYAKKYWGDTSQTIIDFYIASFSTLGANSQVSSKVLFFTGFSDDVSIVSDKEEISIAGRDGSALMIETKTSEKYPNLTSSEIALKIIASHASDGLKAVDASGNSTITATTALAGTYYEADNDRMTDELSEWQLLLYLAQQEQFEVYMIGRALYFGPRVPDNAVPFAIQWDESTSDFSGPTGNYVSLSMNRNLLLARDVKIEVLCWGRNGKRTYFIYSPTRTRRSGAGKQSKPQTYTFRPPDLTWEQAEVYAKARAKEITAHEYTINFAIGAEATLGHKSVITLNGTGTMWDQVYHPDKITRTSRYDGGFVTTVNAKNHPTLSEVPD